MITSQHMLPVAFAAGALLLYAVDAAAIDTSFKFDLEARTFIGVDNSGRTDGGKFDDNFAASLEPEIKGSINDGNTIYNFTPFTRWDSRDDERRHSDIRELHLIHSIGSWETLIGISKVFWGVAESSHLVDIVNQTDVLEGIDGEDKLGQPMLRLSRAFEQTTLTGFVLPGFREREFLGQDNPLSLPFPINNDPVYESGDGDDHVDYALRFSGYHSIFDYGLSWFHGTSREPGFTPGIDGIPRPFYPQIDQFGLDVQATSEAWLWKLEAIRRSFDNQTSGGDFTATVGGVEYSFYGMVDGMFDLGLLAEYHNDSRDDPSTVNFQNDLFLATRFGFNDVESSELLAGVFIDQDDDSTSFRVEANRRVMGDARISLEAQAFSNIEENNIAFSLRDSDFVLLSLELYF